MSLVFVLALGILVVAVLANLTTQVGLTVLTTAAVMVVAAVVCGWLAVMAANGFSSRLVRAKGKVVTYATL